MLIPELQPASHPYFANQNFLQCETLYEEAADFLAEVLDTSERERGPAPPSPVSPVHDISSRPSSHLPRISLPTFDGSFQQWESFRDRFSSMIIEDRSLSNVERLHYLSSCVKNDASRAINHLAITETNFEIAWQILVSRYENKRRLITVYLQSLCNLPPVIKETFENLRNLRDQLNTALQALKNLKRPVETWDDILVFLATQKLNQSSRKAWELKLGDSTEYPSYPSYEEFDKFLESRLILSTSRF